MLGIVMLGADLVFPLKEVMQESIFIILAIAFLLVFLLRLIDNPFGHAHDTSAEDVSID